MLAIGGLFDGIADCVSADPLGWAPIVVTVVSALQAAAATAALLVGRHTDTEEDAAAMPYWAHPYYAQAYQAYAAAQYRQPQVRSETAAADASAQAGGAARQRAPATRGAEETYEEITTRYTEYAGNAAAHDRPAAAGAPATARADQGLPRSGRSTVRDGLGAQQTASEAGPAFPAEQ